MKFTVHDVECQGADDTSDTLFFESCNEMNAGERSLEENAGAEKAKKPLERDFFE